MLRCALDMESGPQHRDVLFSVLCQCSGQELRGATAYCSVHFQPYLAML